MLSAIPPKQIQKSQSTNDEETQLDLSRHTSPFLTLHTSRPRGRHVHPRPQRNRKIILTTHHIPWHSTQPIRTRPNIRQLRRRDTSTVAAARAHTTCVAGSCTEGRGAGAGAEAGARGEVEIGEGGGFAEGVAAGGVLVVLGKELVGGNATYALGMKTRSSNEEIIGENALTLGGL